MPHYYGGGGGPGLIFFPARPADPAAPPQQGEQIAFHEAGHLFAHLLKISSNNAFLDELVPQIFSAAYIRAERPNLTYLLERPFPTPQPTPPVRYTSLVDLNFLRGGMGAQNYFWFQGNLFRLADFLVKDQSFPAIIEKLRAAFPVDPSGEHQQPLEEIVAHLEGVRPGFIKKVAPLTGPTTITRIMPSPCPVPPEKDGAGSLLVVRNDTADPLAVIPPDGRTRRIPAHMWRSYFVMMGAPLKLPGGTCLVARNEPTMAVIEKQ